MGMRLGIVSDLHCNLGGLEEALQRMGAIDELLCLGDSIYEYRFSNEVVERLRELGALVIKGNHEEVFFGVQGDRARAREGNDPALMAWLDGQPYRRDLDLAGRRVLMVHSTPWEPRGAYIYGHTHELQRFGDVDADIVMYGHTHEQLVVRVGGVLVVNPGSAGEGRDHRNGRKLSCAVLNLPDATVEMFDFPNPALPG
jgi:putative phosphoesterase